MPFRLVGAPEDMPVNVRAPQCVTGGAGGASAAAVAAGEVSFGMDTDHLAGVRVRACRLPDILPMAALAHACVLTMAWGMLALIRWWSACMPPRFQVKSLSRDVDWY